MTAVEVDDLPVLNTFVRGLRHAGRRCRADLPYSSGPVKGANTKVKFLKRQMYG